MSEMNAVTAWPSPSVQIDRFLLLIKIKNTRKITTDKLAGKKGNLPM